MSKKDLHLSAANSVNFGRIIFQIIYHIHAYLELVRKETITLGDEIYIVVPSGNFGNALGAYYAKKAGLPVKKILISSNVNNILTELINDGVYDIRDRKLILTESPAMDILKSSNVERVLYDKFGADRTRELMSHLDEKGIYKLSEDELKALREDFDAIYSTDEEGEEVIGDFAKEGYIMDPHTATCIKAYANLREDNTPTVIHSTAEWTKFSKTVAKALGVDAESDSEAMREISSKMEIPIPKKIEELFHKNIVHNTVVNKEEIKQEMLEFLS